MTFVTRAAIWSFVHGSAAQAPASQVLTGVMREVLEDAVRRGRRPWTFKHVASGELATPRRADWHCDETL